MTTITMKQGDKNLPNHQPPRIGSFPLGILPAFRRDPLELYMRAMHQYGDLVRLKFGPYDSWTAFHPDYIKHVLIDNQKNYRRSKVSNNLLKMLTGENLLTSDGDFWRRQRRMMQPAFHRQRIFNFGEVMSEKTARLLADWETVPAGEMLDVSKEMMRVTLAIVTQSLFSQDLSDEANELGQAIAVGSKYFSYRIGRPFAPPMWVPTRRNLEYKRVMAANQQRVPNMIAARRRLIDQKGSAEQTGRRYDMIDLLLDARYEDTGEGMSDEQLASEMRILISAGHETTANSLTWTLSLLSQHPAIEAKLQSEIDTVLQGRTPTMNDLPRLPYTLQVLQESMRLYPAAWLMARQAIAEDQLGPYRLPANQGVVMPIYAIHRHPDFWQDAEQFNPERFAPEQSANQHKFAYFPFGGGPRLCIGNTFALAEAQIILVMVAQRFSLRTKPGYTPVPEPLVTLRIKDGLPMTLQRR